MKGPTLPIILLILLLGSVGVFLAYSGIRFAVSGIPVSFSVAGDFGSNGDSATVLAGMDDDHEDFAIAAGDLSYAGAGSETAWCNMVKAQMPGVQSGAFPFMLITGNHEDDDGPDGHIDNFIRACQSNTLPAPESGPSTLCPGRDMTLGAGGCYGFLYYFDFPATSPVARFIFTYQETTSTVDGIISNYSNGTAYQAWLLDAIDTAHNLGEWVVLVTHKPCISLGGSGGSGCDMHKAAVAHHADLIITGHDHNYQRSKQWTCIRQTFVVPSCLASDGGTTSNYPKGTGTVFVIVGTGGAGLASLTGSTTPPDYFVKSDASTDGYLRVQMTGAGLKADFVQRAIGGFTDSFTIGSFNAPPPVISLNADFAWNPTIPTAGQSTTFTGFASGGTQPYIYRWNWGDGSPIQQTGQAAPTHIFANAGSYTVTLTVTDSTTTTASKAQTVVVVAPTPALTLIFSISTSAPKVGDTVTFTATASGGVPPYSYTWYFGDNKIAAGQTVSHTYGSAGSVIVQATVSDSVGAANLYQQTLIVSPATTSLVASFTWSPVLVLPGQSVTFTASITGGTSPYTLGWNFQDGGTAVTNPALHTFSSAGNYNVTLLVTDAASIQTTVISTVSVLNPIKPPPPTSGCPTGQIRLFGTCLPTSTVIIIAGVAAYVIGTVAFISRARGRRGR